MTINILQAEFKKNLEKFRKDDEKERLKLAEMAFKARMGTVRKYTKADRNIELIAMDITEDIKAVHGTKKISKGDALKKINQYFKSGKLNKKDQDTILWILQKIYKVSKLK